MGARLVLGDKDAATALAAFVRDNSVGNLWVISNDVELLEIVTAESGTVRGVVDFTGDVLRAPGNISYDFGDDYADSAVQNYEYVTYNKTYDELTVQELSLIHIFVKRGYLYDYGWGSSQKLPRCHKGNNRD